MTSVIELPSMCGISCHKVNNIMSFESSTKIPLYESSILYYRVL